MRIDVVVNEPVLLELLFLRAAWTIPVASTLPKVALSPSSTTPGRPSTLDSRDIASDWEECWGRGMAWLLDVRERNLRIHAHFDDPTADPADIAAFLPPNRAKSIGDENFDRRSYEAWRSSLTPAFTELSATPESTGLPELKKAWERGLQTLVVLSFAGTFAKQLDRNAVLLSSDTYLSPVAFSSALEGFNC